MACITSCSIATILIIANLYITLSANQNNATQAFYDTLTPDLKIRYKHIIQERSIIYMRGTGIGIIIAVGFAALFRDYKPLNRKCMLCIVAAITFIFNCMFYIMYPKSDYIITHLTTQTQRNAWLRCYRSYQISYITGLILGSATAYLFANSFCR